MLLAVEFVHVEVVRGKLLTTGTTAFLYLYLYVVESLLGYGTTGERVQLVAYGATTCG